MTSSRTRVLCQRQPPTPGTRAACCRDVHLTRQGPGPRAPDTPPRAPDTPTACSGHPAACSRHPDRVLQDPPRSVPEPRRHVHPTPTACSRNPALDLREPLLPRDLPGTTYWGNGYRVLRERVPHVAGRGRQARRSTPQLSATRTALHGVLAPLARHRRSRAISTTNLPDARGCRGQGAAWLPDHGDRAHQSQPQRRPAPARESE
jgi:hypothetical protein